MKCSNCHFLLPEQAQVCPNCGIFNHPNANEPTYISAPPTYSTIQSPTMVSGSDPYKSFAPSTPQYNVSPPLYRPSGSPPLPGARRGKRPALLVGMILLVIVLAGGGSFLLLSYMLSTTPQATRTSTLEPSPTPNPAWNPYASNAGTLILSDPLQDNSKGFGWNTSSDPFDSTHLDDILACSFSEGSYHVSRTQGGPLICGPKVQDLMLSDLTFEAQVRVTKGDFAGVVVRFDSNKATGYALIVGMQSDFHFYAFNFNAPEASKQETLLREGSNPVIKSGMNQVNRLAIVATGTTLSLYANGQLLTSVQDSTYTSGTIGIWAEGRNGASDVAANNARAWRI